jgi:hypothetical protein
VSSISLSWYRAQFGCTSSFTKTHVDTNTKAGHEQLADAIGRLASRLGISPARRKSPTGPQWLVAKTSSRCLPWAGSRISWGEFSLRRSGCASAEVSVLGSRIATLMALPAFQQQYLCRMEVQVIANRLDLSGTTHARSCMHEIHCHRPR